MNKENFFTIFAGILFVFGIAFYFWIRGAANNINQQNQLDTALENAVLSIDPSFSPKPTNDLSFEASMDVKPKDGEQLVGKIFHNGKGTIRFEAKQSGELVEYYITPENTILCNNTACYRAENDPSDPTFDISTYIYDKTTAKSLGEGLINTGEVPCGDSTCVRWRAPSIVDQHFTVLLEKETNQIILIEGFEGEDLVKIEYAYKDVSVILPLQIEEIEKLEDEPVGPQQHSLPI